MRTFLKAGMILFLCFSTVKLYGQDSSKKFPLNVDLVQSAILPRTGAPIELEWKLSWQGNKILEGVFEIEIFDEERNRSVYRYDMAVTNDIRHFRTLHNYVVANDIYQMVAIYPRFIVDGNVYKLGEFPFRIGSSETRHFQVGYCSDWRGSKKALYQKMSESLFKFEKYDPYQDGKFSFTSTLNLDSNQISDNPIQLCRFDILVIDSYGLSSIRKGQLNSILKWVSAGGALWVRATSEENPRQVELLNLLTEGEMAEPLFLVNPSGNLMTTNGKTSWRQDRDLGRIQVDLLSKLEDMETWTKEDWRERMVYLWRFRGNHLAKIAESGQWKNVDVENLAKKLKEDSEKRYKEQMKKQGVNNPPPYNPYFYYGSDTSFDGQAKGNSLSHNLNMKKPLWVSDAVKVLMPDSIEIPPLSLLLFLAGTYFLIVGPGDYFLLGLFRKRWITWISFPILTILVTVILVQIAHSYMDSDRERTSLVIQDVGQSGEIVRTTELQLLLASSFKTMSTDVKNGLFNSYKGESLEYSEEMVYTPNAYGTSYVPEERMHNSAELDYHGYFPYEYQVKQNVSQWTPELLCVTSIPTEPTTPEFDWESVKGDVIANNMEALKAKAVSAFGPNTQIILSNGNNTRMTRSKDTNAVCNLIKSLSNQSNYGLNLLHLVSRVSPSGAVNLEDVSVIDPTLPDEYWLIIVVPVDDVTRVYRKKYVVKQDD